MKKDSVINFLDKGIIVFIFLFLVSLTNSIFVNQLGYYGALLFMLIKFGVSRKNPFFRNGLENALLLFMVAEILSTIFSIDSASSFHNLLKRFFLLPIIYTVSTAADNEDSLKKIFTTYLVFALISAAIYIINSYDYFIKGLLQITGSGPGVFQYPITTSILISFTAIFVFSFAIDKRYALKWRIIFALLFAITLVAIFATYKRTGWMGLAAGLFIVILIRKKYSLMIPLVILGIAVVFMEKQESSLTVFKNGSEIPARIIKTEGRISQISELDYNIYISDFGNGVLQKKNDDFAPLIKTDAPVIGFTKWGDTHFVAHLIDTRFVLYTSSDSGLVKVSEFISPGYTVDYKSFANLFYVLDSDSGLTVYTDPENTGSRERFRYTREYRFFDVSEENLLLYSKEEMLALYALKNGLPEDEPVRTFDRAGLKFAILDNSDIYFAGSRFAGKSGLDFLETESLDYLPQEADYTQIIKYNSGMIFISAGGSVFVTENDSTGDKLVAAYKPGFIPKSVLLDSKGNLWAANQKSSRLASIVDMYAPSNFVRFALWRAGLKIFLDYPVFGVGDIDLIKLYSSYKRPFDKEVQGHMHNNYVHLLVILGGFGFLVVMYLFYRLGRVFYSAYNKSKYHNFYAPLTSGAFGCYISFLVAGLTEWNFGDHEIVTMLWFITAMVVAAKRNLDSKTQ